jgi:phosphoserine phosphatase
MQPTPLLLTVTGRDRPGITSSFFASLAAYDVDIIDVEQVVIRGELILAVLFSVHTDASSLHRSVRTTAEVLGMHCELVEAEEDVRRPSRRAKPVSRCHVIVLGHPMRPGVLADVAQRITDIGGNIESIAQLSGAPTSSVEMIVSVADILGLRETLIRAAEATGVDIAVELAGLRRRTKRLVVLDVDSTLIQDEGIDVLAQRAGCADEVSAITRQAMNGELDFEQSLRARVDLLAGLGVDEVTAVRDELRLTPGAQRFVQTLKRLGMYVGVVSGGFTIFTDRFVAELGLDFAAANTLEIADGRLTGRVLGEIIDRPGKAAALGRFAEQFRVPMTQTVAVGDGANDIDMLEAAGLGIAFNAKAALRAAADTSLNLPYLDSVLFVLGISSEDIDEAEAHAAGPSVR